MKNPMSHLISVISVISVSSAICMSRWAVLLSVASGACVFVSSSSAGAAETVNATALVRSADRARGGLLEGLEWDVTVNSTEDGDSSVRSFNVKAKESNALVLATAPAGNKGEVFLFNDHDLWFVKPGLRKPVAISSRQRLSGQAANGDIASTQYSKDYTAAIEGKTQIAGQAVYVLKLKATDSKVTYDQIRYYVAASSKLAVRAEFLTVQGQLFKIATFEYGNHIRSGGADSPFVSRMTIVDAKFPANKSVITYANPVAKSIPSSVFNVNNVAR